MIPVRNLEKGPTTFADYKNDVVLEWQGKGDINGLDIQFVPDGLLENPSFMRNINRGILEVIPEDLSVEVQQKLAMQGLGYRERRDSGEAMIESVMDRQVERPLIIGTMDEKGQLVQANVTPREAHEINLNPVSDVGQPEIPQEVAAGSSAPVGNVVQVDEQGRVISQEKAEDFQVFMDPRAKE